MQEHYFYFLGLLFVAVVLISQALLLPSAGKRAKHSAVAKRLQESRSNLDQESVSLLNEHYMTTLSPLDRKLVQLAFFAKAKKMLELANIKWSLSRVLSCVLVLQITTILLLILLGHPSHLVILLSFFLWPIGYFLVEKRSVQRLANFEEQFPDALDVMKRMLVTGHPIKQAFYEVGHELEDPIANEFRHTFNLLNYGYDMRLAVMQMVERNPTVSMMAFSSAVLLQKETGGNLAENLDKVSVVLRSRFKLARKVKTLTAESRMSAWILILVPFVVFIVLNIINPDFTDPLINDPRGIELIMYGLGGITLGTLWIKKIINIEV
ncbi:type II secretion system F family protein [Vibrio sp. B1FLJ16]|uniref:type II secretion system F family protein n=1 Tax=Vibrio sp. B1FLJ16 TaxID=2751178 RepID=UPI0015F55580|nr:type II secretion system F family protein [Vibrio sp. B1FLJ16]CAD7810962.1 COG4965 Flp pilus assembly protein TadB [Vibrio sp. B1FLJ16]CAE6914921.1 COG4965 Flp pilus assembly protein TadB [Vibrio sp. B1FLJ16]